MDDLVHIREVFTRQQQIPENASEAVAGTETVTASIEVVAPAATPQPEPEEDLYSIKNFTV